MNLKDTNRFLTKLFYRDLIMELKEVNFKVVEYKNILINHKREIIFVDFGINVIKEFSI